MFLTLQEIKKHLNIDEGFTEDDDYLNYLYEVCIEAIQKHIDRPLEEVCETVEHTIIEDGQEVNLKVNNTISSLLDELDDDEEIIEFDADKEQTKEEIKKLRKQGINDLLDEL